MNAARRLFLWLSAWGASLAQAAEPVSTQPSVTSFAALMQGLLGLAVVLAALFGFFWLLRRFAPGQTGAQGVVKVVGGVMLGTREKLVVVEVGDQWLLLGVGAGQVSHLHTMPRPADARPAEAGTLPAPFADKLTEFLARRKPN
ncbi:MAG TPA: flagellar biosynthetic protein FliO [Thiobacillaceae bacterium]|nr:flagellar biosynthetic protein FliO [Thiobacillaceae bacterium]